jgi:hypothetical protein
MAMMCKNGKQIEEAHMLRKILILLLIAAPTWGQEMQQHQVRVQNNYDRTIKTINVGPLTFQGVAPDEASEYSPISVGRSNIRGSLTGKGNIYLDGTLVIPNSAPQLWTLVLQADRRFSVVSDLPPPRAKKEVAVDRFRLRFQNWSRSRVRAVRVDDVNMQDIPAGSTTSYVWVSAGTLDVDVDIERSGANLLQERIYIPSEAQYRYTLRLDRAGKLVLIQE